MFRRLMALSALLTLAACGSWPREIYVDERFSEDELREVRAAIAEVNKLAGLIDEDKLVEYAGRFTDDDGRFEQDNFDNGRAELYRIGSVDECWDYVEPYQDEFDSIDNLYGFFTGADIGILVFNTYRVGRPLRYVAMHELGHFVGMDHVTNNRHAIMHPTACEAAAFTAADREAFCLVHGCDPGD